MTFKGKVGANAIVVYEDPAMAGGTTYFGGRVRLGAYGGVPARIIRYRVSEEVIQALIKSRWWDLPVEYFVAKDVRDVAGLAQSIIVDRENGIVSDFAYAKVRKNG